MPRNPKINFDYLQMYFGEPYLIDVQDAVGSIKVYSPTIGDIVKIGENRFYQTLNIFICNTTQYRVLLWDIGKDWNIISDFQLFVMLYKQADPEVSRLLFGDLDFSKFEPLMKYVPVKEKPVENVSDDEIEDPDPQQEAELILWDNDDEIEINANVYNHFAQYLRSVFGIKMDEKITTNETLKTWYINKDKRELERKIKNAENNKEERTSNLQAIISSCVNHPGFKYKLQELKEVGVAEFYDSVKRLQIYEQSTALMKGMYSGFIDGSKIKPEDYNFMREIN